MHDPYDRGRRYDALHLCGAVSDLRQRLHITCPQPPRAAPRPTERLPFSLVSSARAEVLRRQPRHHRPTDQPRDQPPTRRSRRRAAAADARSHEPQPGRARRGRRRASWPAARPAAGAVPRGVSRVPVVPRAPRLPVAADVPDGRLLLHRAGAGRGRADARAGPRRDVPHRRRAAVAACAAHARRATAGTPAAAGAEASCAAAAEWRAPASRAAGEGGMAMGATAAAAAQVGGASNCESLRSLELFCRPRPWPLCKCIRFCLLYPARSPSRLCLRSAEHVLLDSRRVADKLFLDYGNRLARPRTVCIALPDGTCRLRRP